MPKETPEITLAEIEQHLKLCQGDGAGLVHQYSHIRRLVYEYVPWLIEELRQTQLCLDGSEEFRRVAWKEQGVEVPFPENPVR